MSNMVEVPIRDSVFGPDRNESNVEPETQEYEVMAASEECTRLLLKSYAQAFWETDSNGFAINDCPSWRASTGQTKSELLGYGWTKAVHPADLHELKQKWLEAVASRSGINVEARIKSRSGEWRWANVQGLPVLNDSGEIIKWVGLNIDINDRKNSEIELEESERRFKALTLATSDFVYRMSDDCDEITILSSNIEFGREEHSSYTDWMKDFIPAEEHEKFIEKNRETVSSKGIFELEHKVFMGDGSVGWVYTRSVPLLNDKGDIVEWFGISNNITKRKTAEENLKKSREHFETLVQKLKRADENRNSFINTLSHELRNPLASISMGLTILKAAPSGSVQSEKAINIMERQTKQLTHLVDDLLDVTRITQNKIRLKKQLVDLNKMVAHIVFDYQPQFEDKDVKLHFELHTDSIFLEADPERLTQAIGNLLNNAAKFTNEGDTVRVSVKLDQDHEKRALIIVEDTGLGIDPSILPRLFEPFEQADSSLAHSFGGLGLGLTIVKGIIELHNGTVSISSDGIGKGSEFVISLPVKDVQKGGKINIAKEVYEEDQPYSLRILIIEDNPDLADIMSDLLFHLGHEVIVALNGPDGIKKGIGYQPDVLISDIGLPGMSGYEIAEIFQKDERLKNIYRIALSGYTKPEDIERARKVGFMNHLAKPVNLESLKAALLGAYESKNRV